MKKCLISVVLITMLAVMIIGLSGCNKLVIQPLEIDSENLMEGASVVHESIVNKENPDADNMLYDNNKCWTPKNDMRYAKVEFRLAGQKTFNTAVISEVGNEIQYFRLEAKIDGKWETIYSSEKMQDQRIISFDSVTANGLRLCIEKFKMENSCAKIKNIKLYNLSAERSFNTAVYQRIDTEKPSEILKDEDYAKRFARYYDVYNTVIVFDAVTWDENGELIFKNDGVDGLSGKEYFEREIAAIRQLIEMRTIKSNRVNLIVTALADGAGGSRDGVNTLMRNNHTKIAQKMVDTFIVDYELDGLDIDWEYPQTKEDWACYDTFMQELDSKMKLAKPRTIISAALSAGALGMKPETMELIDQIQYMAYDDFDSDGMQSTIYKAHLGIAAFVKNGASKSKINIGIPTYGRPLNGAGFWPSWKKLNKENMYFDSRYERILCENDANYFYYDCTYCSPALAGDKTALALFSGCGGIMVFRLTCDKLMDEGLAVANGIENTIKRYFPNWGK